MEEVAKAHEKGQPVLVGTIAIETSELLSKMLNKRGIPHKVLNAKFHELEAEIVADAGIHGSVTIATNMAGRGTDIKLDEESKELGGLKIIGTERHESRRIDNQLRGRSGRQGSLVLTASWPCLRQWACRRVSRLSTRCFPMQLRKRR